MNWDTILHYAILTGEAVVPIAASIIAGVISILFYQAVGYLPGFLRAYVEKVYREKEARFKAGIEDALKRGIAAADAKLLHGNDKLQYAVDHAIRTNPEGYAHFKATSNMTQQTLKTMAAAEVTIQAPETVIVEKE